MITIGKEIIALKECFGAPWSRFAYLLRYSTWSILFHSISSAVIVCDRRLTERVLANRLTEKEVRDLKREKLIVAAEEDDQFLLDKVSKKAGSHLRKATVTTLLLVVTDDCNLCCRYCFENLKRFSTHKSMSLETMKKAVDHFLALDGGDKSIFFYGGEPLIEWENIKLCVEYVRIRYAGRDVNIQITTNGTIQPDDLIEFCKKHKVCMGVSIDGPKAITNSNRLARQPGIDVFDRALQLILKCRKAKIKCAALCTVGCDSAEQLKEITDFFIDEKIRGLVFNISVRRAGLSVEEEPVLWDRLGHQMSLQYQRLLDHGILEPRGLRYLRGIAESRFTVAECDAGYRGQIVVGPDGLMGPCQAFLHKPEFWVSGESVDNPRIHPLWLRFSSGITLEIESCGGCPFMGTCGGGCRYNRNDFRQPNPNFCQYMRSFLYHTLSRFGRR